MNPARHGVPDRITDDFLDDAQQLLFERFVEASRDVVKADSPDRCNAVLRSLCSSMGDRKLEML